jgi:hypothetical protein
MEPINPPDWLGDMLRASNPNWRTLPVEPPQSEEPKLAEYKEHPCPFCYASTINIAACKACVATKFALRCHHTREEVRVGLRTDWSALSPVSHTQRQIDWRERLPSVNALEVFGAFMMRAARWGFRFGGPNGAPEPPLFYFFPEDEGYATK